MLPNHAPMVIAEQFGTLEALYPGRIDLGLGRAPGTDGHAAQALRRDPMQREPLPAGRPGAAGASSRRCSPARRCRRCRAPARTSRCGSWARARSARSSRRCLGLPYAFASHFAPDDLLEAGRLYREHVPAVRRSSRSRTAMAGLNVVAAETDEEARYLFTTIQQAFAAPPPRTPGPYPPPVDDIETHWTPSERAQAMHMLRYAVVGSPGDGARRASRSSPTSRAWTSSWSSRRCSSTRRGCGPTRSSPRSRGDVAAGGFAGGLTMWYTGLATSTEGGERPVAESPTSPSSSAP